MVTADRRSQQLGDYASRLFDRFGEALRRSSSSASVLAHGILA